MADVTISQLPRLTPSANALIPFSQGGTTYATPFSTFNTNKFFIRADCSGTPTVNMPNAQSDFTGAINILPLNTIDNSGTNPLYVSSLNVVNNGIVIPQTGFYMGIVEIEGYVPNSSWNIRAFSILLSDTNGGQYASSGYFNCTYSYSNTHFCFNPTYTFYANANVTLIVRYQIFSAAGGSQALYQPIYNTASLSLIQLA